MFNPLPVVMADYRRNRLLLAITFALIALAVAIGVGVIAQERALRQGSARAADDFDLLIGAPGSPTQLVLSSVYLKTQAIPLVKGDVLDHVSQEKGVRYAAPIAFGDNWQGHPIVGTVAEFATRGDTLQAAEGRVFTARGEAVIGARVPLKVGQRIAPSHGMQAHEEDDEDTHEHDQAHEHAHEDGHKHEHEHAGHTHNSKHHAHDINYTVVGRMPARNNIWDSAILVPVEDVWALHGLPTGHAPEDTRIGLPWDAAQLPGMPAIAVKPDSVGAAYGLRNKYRTDSSMALFPAEVLNELFSTLGDIRRLMSLMALASQILVVVAVLMALLVGFLARARQFAVLRAIGAGRNYIFAVIWLEVSLLVVSGALAGLALGYAASWPLAQWMAQHTGFAIPLSLGLEECMLAASLAVSGFFIAILPAWLAQRRPIAQGLK